MYIYIYIYTHRYTYIYIYRWKAAVAFKISRSKVSFSDRGFLRLGGTTCLTLLV